MSDSIISSRFFRGFRGGGRQGVYLNRLEEVTWGVHLYVNNLRHKLDTIFFVRSTSKKHMNIKKIQHYAQVVYHLQFDRRVHKICIYQLFFSVLCKMHWQQSIHKFTLQYFPQFSILCSACFILCFFILQYYGCRKCQTFSKFGTGSLGLGQNKFYSKSRVKRKC